MSEIYAGALARFVRSIAILALPGESQSYWLASLNMPGEVRYVDELALELQDGVLLTGQFEQAGWITNETRRLASELDDLLREMSGEEQAWLWEVGSLNTTAEWKAVRNKAL